ncbi:nucleotidyltransferase domain-containing protein [Candidatus Woesearchaeota archaeon]|nr:nucleotidyltransferase domain-containing protein [Candidatus Woesearchaeota archaeon]
MDLKTIKQKILKLDKKKAIRFIVLFGSVAQGRNTPLSDIDIAVYYDAPTKDRFAFRIKMSGELPDKVDAQIFQDLPLTVQNEVLSGKLLYCDNPQFMIEQYTVVIKEFSSFEKYYKHSLEALNREVAA